MELCHPWWFGKGGHNIMKQSRGKGGHDANTAGAREATNTAGAREATNTNTAGAREATNTNTAGAREATNTREPLKRTRLSAL